MNDEKLFEMLDEGIARAVAELEQGHRLDPFAMTLESDDHTEYLSFSKHNPEKQYLLLLEALKAEALHGRIKAAAIIARVTIPDHFGAAVPEGIRIHLEERSSADKKFSARFLYIPYQLYKTAENNTISVHLHHPIPVGLTSEIFI